MRRFQSTLKVFLYTIGMTLKCRSRFRKDKAFSGKGILLLIFILFPRTLIFLKDIDEFENIKQNFLNDSLLAFILMAASFLGIMKWALRSHMAATKIFQVNKFAEKQCWYTYISIF